MPYNTPSQITHTFDIGVTSLTRTFRMPKGKRGRLATLNVENTGTAYNAVTTAAAVALGVSGTPAAYANVSLGTLAAGAMLDAANTAGAIVTETRSLAPKEMPQDTDILLTFTGNTGGSPAGTGRVVVIINTY